GRGPSSSWTSGRRGSTRRRPDARRRGLRTSISRVPGSTAWRAMSEQRIIEARGDRELVLRELMRDTAGDVLSPVAEIDQMFAVVREHLTELIVSLRGDLEELRRLINEPVPAGETSVLAASPVAAAPPSDRGAVPLAEHRGQSAADSFSHVIDSQSGVEIERKFIVSELPPELDRFP